MAEWAVLFGVERSRAHWSTGFFSFLLANQDIQCDDDDSYRLKKKLEHDVHHQDG